MEKRCSKCKEIKNLLEFNKNLKMKDGLQSQCRECNAGASKKWRQDFPEKRKEDSKKQTAKLLQRNPNYYREYYRKNISIQLPKQLAHARARRAKLMEADGDFTAEQFAELCVLYGGICLCCESSSKPLTIDHVIPLSKGGSNWIENIQPLCKSCNSSKGNYHSTDYRLKFALGDLQT